MREEPKIVFENEEVIALNKPAGWVVNEAESVKEETVAGWLKRKGLVKTEGGEDREFLIRAGIAHRLDKETSGCLLVGKSSKAMRELMGQFKRREIKKEYLAVVHGFMEPGEGEVRLPLRRSRRDRQRWEVGYEGKLGVTRWRVEKRWEEEGERFSRVRLWPQTGRTHQIRVHLAHLGYPIVGDEKYLSDKKRAKDRVKYERHLLHAAAISFKNEKKEILVEAEVPWKE